MNLNSNFVVDSKCYIVFMKFYKMFEFLTESIHVFQPHQLFQRSICSKPFLPIEIYGKFFLLKVRQKTPQAIRKDSVKMTENVTSMLLRKKNQFSKDSTK